MYTGLGPRMTLLAATAAEEGLVGAPGSETGEDRGERPFKLSGCLASVTGGVYVVGPVVRMFSKRSTISSNEGRCSGSKCVQPASKSTNTGYRALMSIGSPDKVPALTSIIVLAGARSAPNSQRMTPNAKTSDFCVNFAPGTSNSGAVQSSDSCSSLVLSPLPIGFASPKFPSFTLQSESTKTLALVKSRCSIFWLCRNAMAFARSAAIFSLKSMVRMTPRGGGLCKKVPSCPCFKYSRTMNASPCVLLPPKNCAMFGCFNFTKASHSVSKSSGGRPFESTLHSLTATTAPYKVERYTFAEGVEEMRKPMEMDLRSMVQKERGSRC